MHPELRLLLAAALFGGWLVLFFLGHIAHGLIHLLPVAALFLVPWKLRPPDGSAEPTKSKSASRENP